MAGQRMVKRDLFPLLLPCLDVILALTCSSKAVTPPGLWGVENFLLGFLSLLTLLETAPAFFRVPLSVLGCWLSNHTQEILPEEAACGAGLLRTS
jgi:hypothetical protein